MNKNDIQKRSQEKVNQVLSLMKTLRLEQKVKRQITREGFIEETIFWIDNEQYPFTEENVGEARDPEQTPKEELETNETQDEKTTE